MRVLPALILEQVAALGQDGIHGILGNVALSGQPKKICGSDVQANSVVTHLHIRIMPGIFSASAEIGESCCMCGQADIAAFGPRKWNRLFCQQTFSPRLLFCLALFFSHGIVNSCLFEHDNLPWKSDSKLFPFPLCDGGTETNTEATWAVENRLGLFLCDGRLTCKR